MYYAHHTQSGSETASYNNYSQPLNVAESLGWEDSEVELMERVSGNSYPAEFPCTYSFHYVEEHYTCELSANRPDSYCEVHGGE